MNMKISFCKEKGVVVELVKLKELFQKVMILDDETDRISRMNWWHGPNSLYFSMDSYRS